MQKIEFINPRGGSVCIGGSPPYILASVTGVGALEAELETFTPVGQYGASLFGTRLPAREINLSIHIHGKTRLKMYENRLALNSVLAESCYSDGMTGKLTYSNDCGSWWIPAVVKKGPDPDERLSNYNHAEITFYCPDPLWKSMAQTSVSVASLTGGLEFPFEMNVDRPVEFGSRAYQATIKNNGDTPAPLEAVIIGPAATPKVIKKSTGEYIRVARQLYEADRLYINTAAKGERKVTIVRDNGQEETAFGYLDLSSTFFSLDPGDNLLEYESGDGGTRAEVTISAYSQYGGV